MFATREEFQKAAAALLAGQRALALYPAGHPRVRASLDDCFAVLRRLLQRERRLPIVLAENEFVVGDLQVPVKGETFFELAEAFRHAGIEKLVFLDGLRRWELQNLLRLLSLDTEELEAEGGAAALLEHEGVENLIVGNLAVSEQNAATPDLLVRAWEAYSSGLRVVRQVRHGYRTTGKVEHLAEAKEFAREIVELGSQESRPLLALQALKVHDDYSFTHSINVATLTLAMAQGLGLDSLDLHEVTLAALLHDIGKERVPGKILRKPGKLDTEEWKKMADHSLEGAKALATTPGVGDLAAIVAYEHHLTQDRSSPDAAPWRLHLVSELVTIADVYDALRSKRPYRGEIAPERALEIMHEEADVKFNPDLFTGFTKLVGYYPPGICVALDNGETAISYKTNPEALRSPEVLVVRDADRGVLEYPRPFDLAAQGNGNIVAVRESLDAEAAGIDPFDYL